MERRRVLLTIAGLALLGVGLTATFVSIHGEPPPASDPPPPSAPPGSPAPSAFAGEWMLVELKGGQLSVLRNPRLKTVGERSFLTGEVPVISDILDRDPFRGSTAWLRFDDVTRMGVFRSGDALVQAFRAAKQQKKQ